MNGDTAGFFLGFILAAIIFTNIDPDVYANEIDRANLICAEHKGVALIKTNAATGFVDGQCLDGLEFSDRIRSKP